MLLFLFILALTLTINAQNDCHTPTQQPGACVLINHCPHLFSITLRSNQTENIKTLVKNSYCGLEVGIFPKVCCPNEGIKYFDEAGAISHNQHATKCGLHEPEGPSDPWLALLEYETRDGEHIFECTGVLINKRYILSPAHCLSTKNKLINAHFGKFSDNTNPPSVVAVESTIVHEGYQPNNSNHYNDIMLIRLKNKISFKDSFIRPICILMNTKKNFQRKTLSTTGYEKMVDGAKKRDGIATVWDREQCNLTYHSHRVELKDGQICAGGRRTHYRHFNNMDLGGVLMHVASDNSYSAVGILSLENHDFPKVYTAVSNYIDWIFSNLKP